MNIDFPAFWRKVDHALVVAGEKLAEQAEAYANREEWRP